MFNSRCAMGATTLHRRDILVNRGRGRPHKEWKGFEGGFEKGVEEHDWSHDQQAAKKLAWLAKNEDRKGNRKWCQESGRAQTMNIGADAQVDGERL